MYEVVLACSGMMFIWSFMKIHLLILNLCGGLEHTCTQMYTWMKTHLHVHDDPICHL